MEKEHFSLDCYRKCSVKRFEINYISEMLFDEFVDIVGQQLEPGDFRFEIRKEDKIACRARVVF